MEFVDPQYRQICSSITLYSLKQGFFAEFISTVTSQIKRNWIDNVFAKQETDKDRVQICCTDFEVWKVISDVLKNIKKVNRKKSAKDAYQARCEGIKCAKDGDSKKAILLFTQSIIKAPPLDDDKTVDDGKTLALALKSRAEALYETHRFQDSITDLNLCLEEGYPEPLKYQIYRSIGNNYKQLRDAKRATISWKIAAKLIEEQILRLETTNIAGSKKTKTKDIKLKQVLNKERDDLKNELNAKWLQGGETCIAIGQSENPQTFAEKPEVSVSPNEKYPNASSLISIRRTVEHGRFAVASGSIATGSTLIVESPFSSVLIPEKFGSHCHHCYKRLNTPVACKICSGLAFCSVNCRNEAQSYHQYECAYMGLMQGSGMSVLSFLAYRMITQEGFDFFKTLQNKLEEVSKKKSPTFTPRESQYMHVYNLTNHANLRTAEDYFQRTLMALFLTQCLKGTGFFPLVTKDDMFSKDEISTASLILRHLQVLQFNAHELYETIATAKGQARGAKSIYVAVGIYPTVALFNHECAPTVTRYFHGKDIVIRSVQPLGKGDILSENYGPVFTKRTAAERMRDLNSRYWFKCECTACVEDWPKLEELNNKCLKFRCSTPECKTLFPQFGLNKIKNTTPICPMCFNTTKLTNILKQIENTSSLFEKALSYMDLGKSDMAVPLLIMFLDKVFALSAPPSKNIALAQEALRSCFAQTGNLFIVNN